MRFPWSVRHRVEHDFRFSRLRRIVTPVDICRVSLLGLWMDARVGGRGRQGSVPLSFGLVDDGPEVQRSVLEFRRCHSRMEDTAVLDGGDPLDFAEVRLGPWLARW